MANNAQKRGLHRIQKPGVWARHVVAGDGENDYTADKLAPFHVIPTDEPSGTALEGDMYFDSTAHSLFQYTGSAWEEVGSSFPGDLSVGDDLTLGSDGAILTMGSANPVTLTHSANTLTLGTGDTFVADDITVVDDVTMNSDGAILTMGSANPITLTHSANTLTLGTGDTFVADDITVNDDVTMNSAGAVLTIGDGANAVVLTHSTNTLTMASGDTLAVTSGITAATVTATGAIAGARKVTNVTTTPQALAATDTGTLFTLNKADGIAFTLPAITSGSGINFEFLFETSAAGGSSTITAGAADLLIGAVIAMDTDTSDALVGDAPDATDDLVMTFNGTTQGGLIGTRIKVTAVSGTHWMVEGVNHHSGGFATIFS